MAGLYFKKDHPQYEEMMRIINFLAKTVAARIVHFFGKLWAIVIGKMPSGCWMTSHGDSWIVALWFYMFGIMQIMKAPPEKRAKMEEALVNRLIMIIVYGDDLIQVTDRDEFSEYFNMSQFAAWCKVYVGAVIRNLRQDCPYVVERRGGYKASDGIVFLRHYNVRNKETSPGQASYLPFRNMCDYQIRAVWGRECKDRDIYDFLLSLLGHAYGTYASNFPAYSWLKHAYVASVNILRNEGVDEKVTLGTAINRSHNNSDFVKKARQADISMEDVMKGFPHWETLVKKNVFDEVYHQHIRDDFVEFGR